MDAFRPDLVLLDYHLPKMSGLELLDRLRSRDKRIKAILLTGQGNVEIAVKAMKAGAFDYLAKPLALTELKLAVEKAIGEERIEGTLSYYQKREASASGMAKLLGDSPPMRALKETIRQLIEAERRLTEGDPPAVLISGETGTGKEVVGARPALRRSAEGPALHGGQLRLDPDPAPGVGALGARAGGLHRRQGAQVRPGRGRGPGQPVPGRDRRDRPRHPGEAPEAPGGQDGPAARRPA